MEPQHDAPRADAANLSALGERVEAIATSGGAQEYGAAVYDYELSQGWNHHGDKWFHAASTMPIDVLVRHLDGWGE